MYSAVTWVAYKLKIKRNDSLPKSKNWRPEFCVCERTCSLGDETNRYRENWNVSLHSTQYKRHDICKWRIVIS
jgi:hypothetical protein